MKIRVSQLENLVKKALKKYGYITKEIKVIKDIILYAQLRGNNQGIVKLIGHGIPKNPKSTLPSITKRTKVSALIDGGQSFGMIVMDFMTVLAIKIAKKSGVSVVGSFNSGGSTGGDRLLC